MKVFPNAWTGISCYLKMAGLCRCSSVGVELCLHQGHHFCWIKSFWLREASSSPLSLIPPSLSPPLVALYHFSSSSCSFVFHFTFHFSSHPLFWGTADVPMATIGSMFVWYICGPLITLLARDNNNTSHPELQTEKCQQTDSRKREIMQNNKLRWKKKARRSFQFLFKSVISALFFLEILKT